MNGRSVIDCVPRAQDLRLEFVRLSSTNSKRSLQVLSVECRYRHEALRGETTRRKKGEGKGKDRIRKGDDATGNANSGKGF